MAKYTIIEEKHVYLFPRQYAEFKEIVKPGDIIEVASQNAGWLILEKGGYVYSGFGKYAKPVAEEAPYGPLYPK